MKKIMKRSLSLVLTVVIMLSSLACAMPLNSGATDVEHSFGTVDGYENQLLIGDDTTEENLDTDAKRKGFYNFWVVIDYIDDYVRVSSKDGIEGESKLVFTYLKLEGSTVQEKTCTVPASQLAQQGIICGEQVNTGTGEANVYIWIDGWITNVEFTDIKYDNSDYLWGLNWDSDAEVQLYLKTWKSGELYTLGEGEKFSKHGIGMFSGSVSCDEEKYPTASISIDKTNKSYKQQSEAAVTDLYKVTVGDDQYGKQTFIDATFTASSDIITFSDNAGTLEQTLSISTDDAYKDDIVTGTITATVKTYGDNISTTTNFTVVGYDKPVYEPTYENAANGLGGLKVELVKSSDMSNAVYEGTYDGSTGDLDGTYYVKITNTSSQKATNIIVRQAEASSYYAFQKGEAVANSYATLADLESGILSDRDIKPFKAKGKVIFIACFLSQFVHSL